MIISIDKTLEQRFFEKGLSDDDICSLNELILGFRRGDYYLLLSMDFLKLLTEQYKQELGSAITNFLVYKRDRYATSFSGLPKPNVIIADSGSGYDPSEDAYKVPFFEAKNMRKPILLSEDVSDCNFYAELAKKYYSNGPVFNLDFESTGGCNAKVLTNSCDNHRVLLGIFDSDRHFPGAKIGKTAQHMKDSMKGEKWKANLLILDVRYKENLLPINEYLNQLADPTDAIRCLAAVTPSDDKASFFPFCGLTLTEIQEYSKEPRWFSICSDVIKYACANGLFVANNKKAIIGLSKHAVDEIDLTNLDLSHLGPTQNNDWVKIAEKVYRLGLAPGPFSMSSVS